MKQTDQLRVMVRGHRELRAGRGTVDDVLAMLDYIDALHKQKMARLVPIPPPTMTNAISGPTTVMPRGVRR
jgi:hypothetical protein